MRGRGILLIRVEADSVSSYKFIPLYNPELFTHDVFELILFQEYGVEPYDIERKQILKQSIKKEKIKETLAYACYENNTDKILKLVENAKLKDLDKKIAYCGTPLGLCARNNNIIGFTAIAGAGANVGKVSLADTPLEIAFTYSADIVKFICNNYREVFNKEVDKKGFSLAIHTKDTELLQLLFEYGCDINCNLKPFPPLHNFADYNNIAGLKFLIEHGADINTKNQYKQTPLDRAKAQNNQDAIDFLRLHGAQE